MTATVISAQVITWANGASPAAQNLTVPSDCTALYVLWAHYFPGNVATASFTLAGAAQDQTFNSGGVADDVVSGVRAWYNPPTGTQSLAVSWNFTPTNSGITIVVYVKDGDTTSWRDADGVPSAATSGAARSITLTTQSDDLFLVVDQHSSGTAPANESGFTSITTQVVTGIHSARARYVVANAASETANAQDPVFSTISGIAIPPGVVVVSGSGAVALEALSVSGAGVRTANGAGAVVLAAAEVAGTGERSISGAGAVALSAITVSGTGGSQETVIGSGALVLPELAVAGTGERSVVGAGAIVLAALAVRGTNIVTGALSKLQGLFGFGRLGSR